MTLPTQPAALAPEDIDRLVAAFYARVRADAVLGPVFRRTIGTDDAVWRRHEAKIAGFWRNALGLQVGAYSGNPQMAHIGNSDIMPEHFPIWLGHFRATADEVLTPEQADAIHGMASRIGRGMMMGVESARRPPSEPPRLF
ncbi:group III truncated hemoglobin [Mangrovicoccus sp. HB161399]|uniref:group III truncated hemoglobin n=1 Tax=Mangrovicoccus sp. HB161399 TaxID=2720392 RepID=UPI0015551BCE|nr:group III truncated hemoglobin [Mangrovicoccus sp. HB161399]